MIDINPSFRKLAKIADKVYFSKKVEDVCMILPDLVEACLDKTIVHTEFVMKDEIEDKIYEAFFSPFLDEKNIELGRLIVIYEITEKKKIEQEYISLQAQGISCELNNLGINTVNERLDKLITKFCQVESSVAPELET